MDLLQRLDVWLAGITLAAMAWYLGIRPLLDSFTAGQERRQRPDEVVKPYTPPARSTYVEAPAPFHSRVVSFRASPPEAEAEAGPEAAAENEHAFVTLTEIALHERDADNVEAGMIRAFAALHKGGYLVEGKATEIKRALFGAGGGRKLQALNKAIAAVELAEADAPPPSTTPVALRPTATQAWAGELAKEEHA